MSATNHPRPKPEQSFRDELRCLPRGLMPMPEDSPRRLVEKLVAVVLVFVWSTVYLGTAFDAVAVTQPEYWGIFSAVVFTLVGKLWDLEIDKFLPGNGGGGSSSTDEEE